MSVDPEVERTREAYGYVGDNPLSGGDYTGLSFWEDVTEAAHIVVTVGAVGICVAQPEACALAALGDALINTGLTGLQLATHERSLASALREEAVAIIGDGISFGSAKFWAKLTKLAEDAHLLGSTRAAIAKNARLLNSGAAQWTATQAAIAHVVQEEIQKKEGKCTPTN